MCDYNGLNENTLLFQAHLTSDPCHQLVGAKSGGMDAETEAGRRSAAGTPSSEDMGPRIPRSASPRGPRSRAGSPRHGGRSAQDYILRDTNWARKPENATRVQPTAPLRPTQRTFVSPGPGEYSGARIYHSCGDRQQQSKNQTAASFGFAVAGRNDYTKQFLSTAHQTKMAESFQVGAAVEYSRVKIIRGYLVRRLVGTDTASPARSPRTSPSPPPTRPSRRASRRTARRTPPPSAASRARTCRRHTRARSCRRAWRCPGRRYPPPPAPSLFHPMFCSTFDCIRLFLDCVYIPAFDVTNSASPTCLPS